MGTKTINLKLDFHSGTPIYLQIMEYIRQMVANGELQVGDQLPTVRQLATDLRINFSTVARAYKTLDEERLISTQRGRGTYIWEEPSGATLHRLREKSLTELGVQYLEDVAKLGGSAEDALANLRSIIQSAEKTKAIPSTNLKDQG